MNCKSCDKEIKQSDRFCSSCGGKVINEQLSLKGTWLEFIGPFFSWDSNFGKTIGDLFTQPKEVLNAYISGARERYFKPFSFLIVYATIALLYYKIFPETEEESFLSEFKLGFEKEGDLRVSNDLLAPLESFGNAFYNYYNLYVIFSIPVLAFFSFLALKKYKNNYAEHLVFQAYIQAVLGFCVILLQLIFLDLLMVDHIIFTNIITVVTIIYYNYVFINNYNLNFKSALIVNLKFFGLLCISTILVFLISVLGMIPFIIKTNGV